LNQDCVFCGQAALIEVAIMVDALKAKEPVKMTEMLLCKKHGVTFLKAQARVVEQMMDGVFV
jgi:hypothetical protein